MDDLGRQQRPSDIGDAAAWRRFKHIGRHLPSTCGK